MSFKNLRIRTKLLLGFGLVIVLMVLTSAFAVKQLDAMNKEIDEITGRWMPSVYSIEEMRLGVAIFRRNQIQHLMATTDTDMTRWEKRIEDGMATFTAGQKIYDPIPQTDEEKVIYAKFVDDWGKYAEINTEFLKLSRAGKKDEANALLNIGPARQMFLDCDKALGQIIEINNAGATLAKAHAESVSTTALRLLLIATAIATVAGFIIAWVIASGIAKPIRAMQEAMQRVAEGDFTTATGIEQKDEVGQMAIALDTTVSNLSEVMSEIREAADQTAASGEELSASAQNISSGAQTQASTVEEVNAAIQELTRSIEQVAESATQANTIAQRTSVTAGEGQKTVSSSIDGMKAITDSSQQIAKIIGVINQIANQTNLLALNAAIEAASAGEHGLGFAVVADEVRKLAERSAQAAQEIAQLIEESGKRVGEGTALSQEVSKSLQAILDGVGRTTQGMAGISASAEEQAASAKDVSKNVEGISAVTEENSASAEEMAASAEELSAQAQRLQELVSRFRLAQDSAPAPKPGRKTEMRKTATAQPMRKTGGQHQNAAPAKRATAVIHSDEGDESGAGKALYHE